MSDLSYLETMPATTGILEELKQQGAVIKTLTKDIAALEEKLKEKQSLLKSITHETLPQLLMTNGIELFQLDDGTTVRLKYEAHCNIVKDPEKLKHIVGWLREYQFPEQKIKEQLLCDKSEKEHLLQSNIPFAETVDVNTTSVKAFIQSLKFEPTDLPPGLNYFAQNIAVIEKK